MADHQRHKAAGIRLLTGTALTVAFAVAVVWGARAYGRSIVFAFGVNWVLMVWAIMFASNVVPLRLPGRSVFEGRSTCSMKGEVERCRRQCVPSSR
jgi:hypothetical protein